MSWVGNWVGLWSARWAEIVFWVSLGLTFYAYALYPLVVWILSRCVRDPIAGGAQPLDGPSVPRVTLLVAAYREEKFIVERLKNALALDYPADRLEILIGCDGEEDQTGHLARTFIDPRVRVLQFPSRRGKASVLNDCIPQATGEIIVLSDANTMMEPDSVQRLVRHFRDPRVGGVCGKLVLVDPAGARNVDGLYWRYENMLKECEARLGALLGVNGAIYAIRKELYVPLSEHTIIDDFVIGMRLHQQGYRLLYDESAVAVEETPTTIGSEFRRRMRIGAGGFQSLCLLRPLLSPRYGRVSLAFWSHKVLRWCCPAFMIAAYIGNACLTHQRMYRHVLVGHSLFYVFAIAGLFFATGKRWERPFRIPSMFVSMNAALFCGFFRWVSGHQRGTWRRT